MLLRSVVVRSTALVCLVCACLPSVAVPDVAELSASMETAAELGEHDQLRELLAQAQAESPKDPAVLFWAGRVEMIDDDFKAAMKLFDEARELEPTNSEYHRWAGHAHIEKLQTVNMFSKRGLAKKAIKRFLKAVEVDPANADAREALAQYYLQAPGIVGGSKDKGLEQIEELKKIDPAMATAALGWHYYGKKKYEEAEHQFEEGLELAPGNARAHYDHALFRQSRKEWDGAFAGFAGTRQMTETADNRRDRILHVTSLYQLGRTSAFSGERLDEGLDWMQQYLELEYEYGMPKATHAYWRIGLIHEHRNDRDAARIAYERAIELDPENKEAKKSLKKLE